MTKETKTAAQGTVPVTLEAEESPLAEPEPVNGMQDLSEEQKQEIYEHILSLGRGKYDHERVRETSLIRQASNLQLVYAILFGVLILLTKILMEYCTKDIIPQAYIAGAGIVMLPIIAGMVMASCAQYRSFKNQRQNVQTVATEVQGNPVQYLAASERMKHEIDIIISREGPLSHTNNARVGCIHSSIILLYVVFVLFLALLIFAMVMTF